MDEYYVGKEPTLAERVVLLERQVRRLESIAMVLAERHEPLEDNNQFAGLIREVKANRAQRDAA